jgi:hypothetical protein
MMEMGISGRMVNGVSRNVIDMEDFLAEWIR